MLNARPLENSRQGFCQVRNVCGVDDVSTLRRRRYDDSVDGGCAFEVASASRRADGRTIPDIMLSLGSNSFRPMKLHFHPLSGNSRRVRLVAAHLQIPLEQVVVDLVTGEQRGEAHRALNPNARVPVLEDDGFVLWESRAIMVYLTEKVADQTLLPAEARGRAEVNRWLFWCAAHMAPANTILVQENMVKGIRGQKADPAEVARGEALFTQSATVLDAQLAGRSWVCLDRLTLADFSIAASFALAGPARFPMASYANLRAWLERVQELDAWKRTAPPQMPQ